MVVGLPQGLHRDAPSYHLDVHRSAKTKPSTLLCARTPSAHDVIGVPPYDVILRSRHAAMRVVMILWGSFANVYDAVCKSVTSK